jgi:type IX secretion system substrate protein/NHL repeat-containing protein
MKKITQQLTLYFVLFLGAQFAIAQTTIAENTSFSNIYGGGHQIGQSFTPTSSAVLSSFNLSFTGTINSGTYNLYEGEGTSGTLLDSGNVVTGTGTGSTPKTWVTFSSNINVSSGSVYTLIWNISSPDFNFYVSINNPYAGGFDYSFDAMDNMYLANGNWDLAFNVKGVTNTAPTATNVSFSGTVEVGQQLTGTYTYTDADSDTESGSTYKWYRSDDSSGANKAAISGATSTTYTLVTADAHKYISFEVTPNDGTAFGTAVESALQTVVNSVPTFTSTAVTSIDENQTYTYTITTNDVDNDLVVITAPTLPSWLSLTVTGSVTVGTLAGDGTYGFADGTGLVAQFASPAGVAVDDSGTVYIADTYNNRIRKITAGGVVTTLAGSGTAGFADGTGTAAQFNIPAGVAVDGAGTVYVADLLNHRIRKITSAGEVTTLAGSGTAGFADGSGTTAQFDQPTDVAVDASGTVYVADLYNHRIRKITVGGEVTTLAGSTAGFADGTGTAAQFTFPQGVAVDGSGNVYVADDSNSRIRKITAAGEVTTLAGSGFGFADGIGTAAQFDGPQGVAVDGSGTVYVADTHNNRIRKITPSGVVSTLAGSGTTGGSSVGGGGFADGTGTAAQFNSPQGVAVEVSGTVYVADKGNNRIRKIVQNKMLTGDTTGQAGTHNVVLNANDGNGGSTNQSFTITVNDVTPPTVSTLVPADNATGVTSSNLQIDFNENIQKGTGDILIKRVSDDQVVATIPVSGSEVVIGNGTVTITISPTITLPSNTDLYVVIPNTAFTDMSGNAFAGLTTNTLWNFSTSTVLGIEDNIIKGFALYPNPVKGVLNIRAQETLKTIQVFNLMGQQVFLKHLNSNKTTINLNRLPQGSYFVKIITDKTTKSVKLIKR